MPDSTFPDLPILGELGAALDAAMARAVAAAPDETTAPQLGAAPESAAPPALNGHARPTSTAPATPAGAAHPRRWRRISGRPLPTIVVALLLGGLGTSTAAATLTVLRGSPIPIPRAADVQPVMAPKSGTEQVVALRAPRPGGGDPFALRVGLSETGLSCVTVGQARGAQFGVVGTDGVFRDLPSEIVDGCGKPTPNKPTVLGARVFDTAKYDDVRTVVYGIGGPDLRRAELEQRGVWSPLAVTDGRFEKAVRGYPEDPALTMRLTYASGRTSIHEVGKSSTSSPDPEGPAWKFQAGTIGGTGTICLDTFQARLPYATAPHPAPVCGRTIGLTNTLLRAPYVLSIRRFSGHDRGGKRFGNLPGPLWNWHGASARTFAYGFADPKKVARVRVFLRDGTTIRAFKPWGGQDFVVAMLGTTRPSDVRVTFTMTSGAAKTYAADVNTSPTTLPHPKKTTGGSR